jgi:hypothetical protein
VLIGKRIIDGPHRLDIAVRAGTTIRSIDHSSQVKFGFRHVSDSRIAPLLRAGDTGNQRKKESN